MKETNSLFIEEIGGTAEVVRDFLITSGMMDDVGDSVAKQTNQLKEEVLELVAAIIANDKVEVMDGLGDVGFVLLSLEILGQSHEAMRAWLKGTTYLLGLDLSVLHEAILIAAVSNLSKFDRSTEEASITQEYYSSIGVETKVKKVNDLFVVFVSKAVEVDGKPYHAGKILKSKLNFIEADFAGMAENYIVLFDVVSMSLGAMK